MMRIVAVVAIVLSTALMARQTSQAPDCAEVARLAAIATAKSPASLLELRKKIGNAYRSRLVFAARWFELHPKDPSAASALLELIPGDKEQHLTWLTFGDPLCEAESISQAVSLLRIGDRLPRDMASAVVLVPSKMKAYVEYALRTTDVPDSDYVEQMERPCRARHAEFAEAVNALPPKSLEFFRLRVFKVDGCVPLILSSAWDGRSRSSHRLWAVTPDYQ